MIGSFRNFSKSKFAGVLVFIMIIPFVFWGMGGMFSSGNTNNIAKINNTNISTEDFLNHVNTLEISPDYIRKNLDKNVIEELLSTLITTKILNLEVESFNIALSENSLSKKIKNNKSFLDKNGIFQRVKYEKFLLLLIFFNKEFSLKAILKLSTSRFNISDVIKVESNSSITFLSRFFLI